jgi:hypothetical protein
MLKLKSVLSALALASMLVAGLPSTTFAQGCGSSNPNCVVPTAPVGANNNQAASTKFVQNQIGAGAFVPIAGLGTGVFSALNNPLNGTGGLVGFSGALGTPASGNLANTTGFPVANLAGAGTGVLSALGNPLNAGGGLVGFSGALGAATFTSLSGTAEPSTSFGFGGQNTLNTMLLNVPGTNASEAEAALTLQMASSNGNSNVTEFYKAGLQIATSGTGNTGSIWGGVFSTELSSLTGAKPPGNITLELDNNNAGVAATGLGTPNTFNLFLSGTVDSSAHLNQGMICMCYGGANPLAQYGLAATDFGNKEFTIATIFDDTHSPTLLLDNGVHTNGINLGGTYSNFAISSPNFFVDGSGDVHAAVATFTGSETAAANIAGGSHPTLSGTCAAGTQVGGNTSGSFKLTAACSAETVIMTFATTAPNGWACKASDLTTPADALNQTASTAATATLTGTGASADLISFLCTAF